jgi:hypothetical protein
MLVRAKGKTGLNPWYIEPGDLVVMWGALGRVVEFDKVNALIHIKFGVAVRRMRWPLSARFMDKPARGLK